jgi:cytochrome c553
MSEVVPQEPSLSGNRPQRPTATAGPEEPAPEDEPEGSIGSLGSMGSVDGAALQQQAAVRRSKRACAYCHEKKGERPWPPRSE